MHHWIVYCALLWFATVLGMGCATGSTPSSQEKSLQDRVAILEEKLAAQNETFQRAKALLSAQNQRAKSLQKHNKSPQTNHRQHRSLCPTLMLRETFERLNAIKPGSVDIAPQCILTKTPSAIILKAQQRVHRGAQQGALALEMWLYTTYLEADGRDEPWASALEKAFAMAPSWINKSDHLRQTVGKDIPTFRCASTVCISVAPRQGESFDRIIAESPNPILSRSFRGGFGFSGPNRQQVEMHYRTHFTIPSRQDIQKAVLDYLNTKRP